MVGAVQFPPWPPLLNRFPKTQVPTKFFLSDIATSPRTVLSFWHIQA